MIRYRQTAVDVIRVTRDGYRMPRYTSIGAEERLGVEMLDREHQMADHVIRRRRLRQLESDALLDDAEGTLQVVDQTLGNLARQENVLLALSDTNKSTEAAKELEKDKEKASEPLRKILASWSLK